MNKSFLNDVSGNFAITLALLAVPLMGSIGVAVDYSQYYRIHSSMQDTSDAAALAGVKELAISGASETNAVAVAKQYVTQNINITDIKNLKTEPVVDVNNNSLQVNLSYVWAPLFAHYIDSKVLPIKTSSQANLAFENTSVCVLALDQSSDAAIYVDQKSEMFADDCAIFSNSSSKIGISVNSDASMKASSIMSAGGYQGSSANLNPKPITDVPKLADPLNSRAEPNVGMCNYNNFFIDEDVNTLKPGVYCGGLNVEGTATAKLDPGTYIIKDGPLSIQGNASLIGEKVGFYFTGDQAVFDFGVSTQAELSAPETGLMAGLLFFESRSSVVGRTFTIRSKDAEKFEGTIYLPKSTLYIDKESRVGQSSKWTAIIVDKVNIGKGPQLQINSDYANSKVPVPEGIKGTNEARLVK